MTNFKQLSVLSMQFEQTNYNININLPSLSDWEN